MDPKFFAAPSDWRSWLERNHSSEIEVWVGLYKKKSGMPSMTWPEAVDEALCFGWIDSVRKSIDDVSYTNRFTPRKPGSAWSSVNIGRVGELTRLGLMHPAGLLAFERRAAANAEIYSYEQRHAAALEPVHERQFRSNRKAWAYFHAQPAGYRKSAIWWVISAKREATRIGRLVRLIDHSERGELIPPLRRPMPRKPS